MADATPKNLSMDAILGVSQDQYNQAAPATKKKTQQFNKNQSAKQQQIQQQKAAEDNSLAGKIEGAVGGFISGAIDKFQSIPLIGKAVNPALNIMSGIQENLIDPAAQTASAAMLMNQIPDQGSLVENWRFAFNQAKKISFGQATVAATLPGLMPDDFNIFDEKKRNEEFRNGAGWLLSGLTDLALNAAGSKGTGALMRTGMKAATGSRVIDMSEEGIAAFTTRVNNAVAHIDGGKTSEVTLAEKSAASLIEDAVKETRPEVLVTNPLIQQSNNVNRAATILAEAKTPREVADFLLAEKGDKEALSRLSASIADIVDNHGVKSLDPIYDFKQIYALPEPEMRDNLSQILVDLGKRNKPLADALDDFAAEKARGIGLNSYQPSRFASLDRLSTLRDKTRISAAMGELTPLGKGEWQAKIYQTTPYDRTVRIISWLGSGRPNGIINITNPRRNEALNDLLADLSATTALRGSKGDAMRRDIASQWVKASTDTERAKIIADAEQRALAIIADHYGVSGVRPVFEGDMDAVSYIRKHHAEVSQRRQSALDFLQQTDGILTDVDGNINLVSAPHLTIRSNAAQSVPILNFRSLEVELQSHIRNLASKGGEYAGISPVGIAGEMSAESAKAFGRKAWMNLETFLDISNMVFSNLNLLRLAYIPKNSMIDPWFRASMETESAFGLKDSLKGMSNVIRNQTKRSQSSWIRATNRGNIRIKRAELNAYTGDLNDAIRLETKISNDIAGLQSQLVDANRMIRARKAAKTKAKTPEGKANAEAALQEIFDAHRKTKDAIKLAEADLDQARANITAVSSILSKTRDELYGITSRIHGADAARRHIGEDKWTLDVDGTKYEIDGLADPSVKGASAYLSEIDSAQDWYAATQQSSFARRYAAQQQSWVKINRNRDPDGYMNALAHVANRQLRNDEVGRMLLSGKTVDEVFSWMSETSAGRKYLQQMSGRWGVSDDMITEDALRLWIRGTGDRINAMYPDENLKALILKRNVSTEEVSDILSGRNDLLDEVDGPNVSMLDINGWEKAASAVTRVTDTGWKLLSGVENRLVRNPLFLKYTADAMKNQIRLAKAAGIDVTQDVVNNEIRQVAYREALQRVEQILYSARRQTNGGHIMRYLMAFPTAFFNSQVVAAKLIAKNPYNAYWYTRVTDAADVFGTYEDRDGNQYTNIQDVPEGTPVSVKIPLYGDAVADWLKPYMDPRGGGLKLNPKQFEFMVGDPSVSFFGSIGVSKLMMAAANNSIFGVYGEDIAAHLRKTLGNDVYESSVLYGGYPNDSIASGMLPGYMQSLLSAVHGLASGKPQGALGDTQFASDTAAQYKTAVANWYKDGMIGTRPDMGDAVKTTSLFYFMRSLIQFNAPVSVQFDPVTAAMTRYYGDAVDAYNGDYKKAEDSIVNNFGIDALALIGSSNKNRAGLVSSMTDIKVLRKNGALMKEIADKTASFELAGMLSSGYSDITKEYSTEVAALYRKMTYPGSGMDLVKVQEAEDIVQSTQTRMGWYEWTKAVEWRDSKMAELGIKSTYEKRYTSSGLKAKMTEYQNSLEEAYPQWAAAHTQAGTNFRKQTFKAANIITSDKKWMSANADDPKWQEIARWVENANRFYTAYDQLKATGGTTKPLRQAWSEWHHQYTNNASVEFQLFESRWLSRMPELIDDEKVQ